MEFFILGPLEVRDGLRQIEIPGGKQRALLALLLLNANRVLSLDQLIDELWGAQTPESGRKAAQVRVSQLRRVFSDAGVQAEVIISRAGGYMIMTEPDQLDLQRFERLGREGAALLAAGDARLAAEALDEALALWRGDPLVGCDAPFVDIASARLSELHLSITEASIDAKLALGRHAELTGALPDLIRGNPFRERLRIQLMLALYRAGRQADALAAYRDAREHLIDQLGIEPGREMQELEKAILEHDPRIDPPEESPTAVRAVPGAAQGSIVVAPSDLAQTATLLEVAATLASRAGQELIVAGIVGPDDDPGRAAAEINSLISTGGEPATTARTAAFTSEDRGGDLVRLAIEQEAAVIVSDAPEGLAPEGAPSGDLATVWHHAPCDVAVLIAGPSEGLRGDGVVVPFGGSHHDWGALELGAKIAASRGVALRLLGAKDRPWARKRDASRLLAGASLISQRAVGVAAEPVFVSAGVDALVAAAEGAGLLVLGLSDRWPHEGIGPVRIGLVKQAGCPVLLIRRGLRPSSLSPPERFTRYTWSIPES